MLKGRNALQERDSEVERAVAHISELEKQQVETSGALRTAHEEMLKAQETVRERESQLKASREESQARVSALEDEQARLENELGAAKRATAQIQEQVEEMQRRFLDQTNAFLAATQSENERLALLIDTVQSSSFWKIKRVFGRVRRAFIG